MGKAAYAGKSTSWLREPEILDACARQFGRRVTRRDVKLTNKTWRARRRTPAIGGGAQTASRLTLYSSFGYRQLKTSALVVTAMNSLYTESGTRSDCFGVWTTCDALRRVSYAPGTVRYDKLISRDQGFAWVRPRSTERSYVRQRTERQLVDVGEASDHYRSSDLRPVCFAIRTASLARFLQRRGTRIRNRASPPGKEFYVSPTDA